MSDSLHIGFPIFPDLTQLDLTGPWEVFTRLPGAVCHLVSHDLHPVRSASGGLTILPTTTYSLCPRLDVICVPGGPGEIKAMGDEALLDFLRKQAEQARYVTSVCTGAMVLAAAGLLTGYRATTHWLSVDRLATFGAIPVRERVVIDRNRVTGGGVTAGIDFALTLAAALVDEDTARAIALQIEYAPAPPFPGDPAAAHPTLVAQLRTRAASFQATRAAADAVALRRLRR